MISYSPSELCYRGPIGTKNPYFPSETDEGGYVEEVVTYMVMDDLSVKPLSTVSIMTLLDKLNVKEIATLEEKVVDLGMDEVYVINHLCFLCIYDIYSLLLPSVIFFLLKIMAK